MRSLILTMLVLLLAVAATAKQTPPATVIIIGAGMSGISAARTLDEAGVKDILILEASSRIGGRMMKTDFAGFTVELGANYIFGGGPVHNPILEIADKLKLKTYLNNYENITANTYKQEGGLYPKKVVEAVDNVALAREEFYHKFSRILSSKPNDVDVSIAGAQRIFKQVPKTPLEMVIDYYHGDYEDGDEPKMTSLKHTYPRGEMVDHGDDSLFVYDSRGFEIVPQYIAKQFLKPSLKTDRRLKLNKVVREIIYTKGGVAVKTEDGSVYRAKFALVSASIGVLQSDLIKFKPTLPLWKRVAISEYSMTIYTKIFLKFPHAFWPISGAGSEFFLYTHERRGYYPLWQHLEFEHPGSNILFVTVTADESRRIEELKDEEVEEEIMEVLKKMFGDEIPKAEHILVPRWGKDRFYQGSYSNWPSRYSQRRHDQLGAPVGPVYFTGEHLHNKYIAYVTGAYYAGIDSANDILGCIKNNTCKGYGSQHLV